MRARLHHFLCVTALRVIREYVVHSVWMGDAVALGFACVSGGVGTLVIWTLRYDDASCEGWVSLLVA